MVTEEATPRLRRGVRLTYDPVRDHNVLLFPEGVLVPNETAAAVLCRCDGVSTVRAIVASLAESYEGVCFDEVADLLDRLRARRLIEVGDG